MKKQLTIENIYDTINENIAALHAEGFTEGFSHICFEKDAAHNYERFGLVTFSYQVKPVITIPEDAVYAALYVSSYQVTPNTYGHPTREYTTVFTIQ